jgi:hypothetical protein
MMSGLGLFLHDLLGLRANSRNLTLRASGQGNCSPTASGFATAISTRGLMNGFPSRFQPALMTRI